MKKLKDIKTLIEYKGDFVTPEELAGILGVSMDFELVEPSDDISWFEKAMIELDRKGELN